MKELENTFYVIAFDTPGFGGSFSPVAKPTIEYYSQCMLEALDTIGITTCSIFGHHTGAAIGVQMAIERPTLVQNLVLSGPACTTSEEREHHLKRIRPMVIDSAGGHLLQLRRLSQGRDRMRWPLALVHRETVLNLHAGERYHEAYEAVYNTDLRAKLSKISCHTLVVAEDSYVNYSASLHAAEMLGVGTPHIIPKGDVYLCDLRAKDLAKLLKTSFV